MAEANSSVNPWVRSEQELFNIETLQLIPAGQQEEYVRIMKQLAHAKGIAALALEQVYLAEEERHAFFEPFTKRKDCVSHQGLVQSFTPDYTTGIEDA